MKQPPAIAIELIHIEGPMKGEIQEFNLPEVTIGRNPNCQVRFPKDLATISRQHARITREGNRFMLVDQSTNGTFVNGKQIKEAILKDGDVLQFSAGGPKLSFISRILENIPETGLSSPSALSSTVEEVVTTPPPEPIPPRPPIQPAAPRPVSPAPIEPPPARPQVTPIMAEPVGERQRGDIPILPVKRPLVVQYGPTLQSYNTLPITVGKGPQCDFKLDHPALFERHAQIFFYQDHYWIKDLTGKGIVRINGQGVAGEGMLEPDYHLSLSPQGPHFRFLGGGRLAETEPLDLGPSTPGPNLRPPDEPSRAPQSKGVKELGSMMKRILKRT